MRRLLVRPLAKDDLNEQVRCTAQDNVDAALRFLDAAEAAFEFELIRTRPQGEILLSLGCQPRPVRLPFP